MTPADISKAQDMSSRCLQTSSKSSTKTQLNPSITFTEQTRLMSGSGSSTRISYVFDCLADEYYHTATCSLLNLRTNPAPTHIKNSTSGVG